MLTFVNGDSNSSFKFDRLSKTRIFTAFCGIALSLTLGSLSAFAADTYYVSSQNGNDSWSGLLAAPNGSFSDGPFQTLGRAQSAMRSSGTKAATVRAGTYQLPSNMNFNSSDSSESWMAYSGESPAIDGGGSRNFSLTNLNNFSFQGLTFSNLGRGGLQFVWATNISIRGNTFNNCNGSCVNGAAFNSSALDSNTVNGNTGTDSVFIFSGGSSNNQITHNLVQNTQGGGVNLNNGPSDPPINNNIIDRNLLINTNTNNHDQGAVYIYDTSHRSVGNQITNNVIRGTGGGSMTTWIKAIYLDDLTSNVLVNGNVCSQCGQWAFQIHSGDHNVFTNNIFDLSSGAMLGIYQTEPPETNTSDFGMTGNVFQRNIVYYGGSIPSSLYQVNVIASDALPNTSGNIYFSSTGARVPNGDTIVDASPVYADPQFAQPSAGNYSMPSSSPAFNVIGFQPLPTDQGPVGTTAAQASVPAAPVTAPTSVGSTGTGGQLSGTGSSTNSTVNLTTEGAIDWAHWGATSLTRKRGVTPQIGPWSIVGPGAAVYYSDDPRPVTFTDGDVPASATVRDGIYTNGQTGFSFSVPAGTTSHTLTVHVGGFFSGGAFKAHLSDGSAADYVDTTQIINGQYDRNYTINFKAGSAGSTLVISWVRNSGTGNVTLNGAALQ